MKKILFTFLTPIFLFAQPSSLPPKKKIVFIIVDGISYNQLQLAHTPNLDAIGKQGTFLQAYVGGNEGTYNETPTISAVGYNSLITGTWANKHQVYGNEIKNPNYNYPSIFKIYKDTNPSGTIGVFSSWLDNRTKLVGDNLPQTNSLKVDFSYDGLENDSINFPHDDKSNYMKLIDFSVAMKASETILKDGPDVSWVYLEFSDDMGHAYGNSEYFNAAIKFEDYLVGKIYDAVIQRSASENEDWLFVVTTDHGRKKVDGKDHGGHTDSERSTWIVSNLKFHNSYKDTQIASIVDLLPTMVDFLEVTVPLTIQREWDGQSLFNSPDVTDFRAIIKDQKLYLHWKSQNETDQIVNLYASETNHFFEGDLDNYSLIGKALLNKGVFEIPISKLKIDKVEKGFYKLLLETENTRLNYWIINK